MTIKVLIGSAFISFILGFIGGIFSCNHLKVSRISRWIESVGFVFRAIPFMVLLLIVYFVLPDLFGFNLDPFPAAIIALGMCSSGYVLQIVRGGINSIPVSQWEAAFSLGYSTFQSFMYVILPQVWRNILPSCTNEIDSLLKSTAVVSTIGMLELTRVGMNLVSRQMQPVPIYLTIAVFYICMSAAINLLTRMIERKVSYVKN